MRFSLVILGLLALIFAAPNVELSAEPATDTAQPASAFGGPQFVADAGADTLVFPVPVRRAGGPILPDLPLPLPDAAPDALPQVIEVAPNRADVAQQAEFLSAESAPKYTKRHRRITANSLNLRAGPSKRARSVTALHAGDIAEVTGKRRGGWVPIKVVASGRTGWVFWRYLAPVRG